MRLLLLAGPVAWVLVANVAPLLAMARISLLDSYPANPGRPDTYTLAAYAALLHGPAYQAALLRSLGFAAVVTVAALLLCYPLAYHVALHVPPKRRAQRLLLLVAPFWTTEIVRVFATALLLGNRGAVNLALRWAGLIDAPAPLMYGGFSVGFGMMQAVLLSMLLPIYAALDQLPRELLDAAGDLGAGPWRRLGLVTLPLSAGGVAAGCSLAFLLALGAFAVPQMLGGAGTTLFAETIAGFFGSAAGRWPIGAAFSLVLLLLGAAVAACLAGLVRVRPI